MAKILFAAGAALLLAACGNENAESSGNNALAVPADGGEAENVAGPRPVRPGDNSSSPIQPSPPIAPDPSDRAPVEPPVQVNNQVSNSDEPPPATEDEYLHRNKVGESPPPR